VLRDCRWINGALISFRIDPNSKQGRRAIARFHSDACRTMRCAAPRWCRRTFDHRRRTRNTRELSRWVDDPGYDPVCDVRHRQSANWAWR